MARIWTVIAEVGIELHPDRIHAIANQVRALESVSNVSALRRAFSPRNLDLYEQLRQAWEATPEISPIEVASALRAASATSTVAELRTKVELVWTGPSTGLVPVRHTDQVLCGVINSAKQRLFIVSFVAYEVDMITRALKNAVRRDVQIDILLESSSQHGGHVSVDSIKAMKDVVPQANFYTWKPENQNGSVHAKCAVSDGGIAFITSANITQAAMERNMELGLLVTGGTVPETLARHLQYLVATRAVDPV